MSIKRLSYYCALAVTLSGLGCVAIDGETGGETGSDATSETEYDEPTSLSAEDDGGYTTEDEESGFGLESMEQFEADEEEEDPSVTEEEEAEAEEEPGADVYLIRIVWGNLELNPRHEFSDRRDEDDREETVKLDWDGSLSYDGAGVLRLKRVILFEGRDHIVDEDDPQAVEWVSHTGPHIDGILAKLIVEPGTDPDVLTFDTDAMTHEIALADLDHYNEIVLLDEDGHGAAFTALKVNDDDCAEGFVEGKFHDRPRGEGGMFRGRVLSEVGELNGHIRGHYGDRDGDQVFFGKYVNAEGLFRGLLRGTYGDGAFEGDWIAKHGELEGTLSGKYVTGEDVESGFFQGFWEQNCAE